MHEYPGVTYCHLCGGSFRADIGAACPCTARKLQANIDRALEKEDFQ
jgi:hypothetical protein